MKLIFLLLFSITVLAKDITVLEVDTGVDLSHVELRSHVNIKDWEDTTNFTDFHGHGTHVAGIILKDTCKEVQLSSCKYYDLSNKSSNPVKCFKKAITTHYDFINFSSGGPTFDQEEYDILKQIKSLIIVAAGNNGKDLSIFSYYPASYKLTNVIAVGNLEGDIPNLTSNYNLKDMVWENGTNIYSYFPGGRYGIMSGTSQATALHTNKLLKEKCLEQNNKL